MNCKLKDSKEKIWDIYKVANNTDELFANLFENLKSIINIDLLLFYIEDDKIINGIEKIKLKSKNRKTKISSNIDEYKIYPLYSKKLILNYAYVKNDNLLFEESINSDLIKIEQFEKISNSTYYSEVESKSFGIETFSNKNYDKVSCFYSPKINLCKAFILLKINDNEEDIKYIIGDLLDFFNPSIEAVYRRQIDRMMRKILKASDFIYTGDPGYIFQASFQKICKLMEVEGGSIIVKGLPSSSSTLQLVSTYPKDMPKDRVIYKEDQFSTTQWFFSIGDSFIIDDVEKVRKDLIDLSPVPVSNGPVWCDVNHEDEKRCVMCNFYKGSDDVVYSLRFTNSNKVYHKKFNVIERKIAEEIVPSLALLHKSLENEYRASKIFTLVKHEWGQKLIGLKSAANYVKKSIKYNKDKFFNVDECNMKLLHINNTIAEIDQMLDRFVFPLPSLSEESAKIYPIKPYADLVKPICETFLEKAKDKKLFFDYHGKDQLGILYSDKSKWMQVVENLVNNMIKYSYPGTDEDEGRLQIAFERNPKGGGSIHFASYSIPISDEEKDKIFTLKYRAKEAIKMTNEGDGLGLFISQSIASTFGSQILLRIVDGINIFTVNFPGYLFRKNVDVNI